MKTRIFYDGLKFRLKGWKKTVEVIEELIKKENKLPGDINIIITGDNVVKELNNNFLKHNYYTDVITFDYNKENIVNGEIYISLDRVRKNSINYKVSLKDEVLRVMFHGILHLCGYKDERMKEKKEMRAKEDEWLKYFSRKY